MTDPVASQLSSLFAATSRGDPHASRKLFDVLYMELHRLAESQLGRLGGGLTLGTTTLLHEAYIEMSHRETEFPDRGRFLAYAAKVMRGLIIDYARRRRAQKRGGAFVMQPLDDDVLDPAADHRELAMIAEAVDELAAMDASLADLVNLKFFCGFSFAEIAAMRGTPDRTLQRQWEKARLYLRGALESAAR